MARIIYLTAAKILVSLYEAHSIALSVCHFHRFNQSYGFIDNSIQSEIEGYQNHQD